MSTDTPLERAVRHVADAYAAPALGIVHHRTRVSTEWRRSVAELAFECPECDCVLAGADINALRAIIRSDADEIDRLRGLIAALYQETK